MIKRFPIILVIVFAVVLASAACAGENIKADPDLLAARQSMVAKIKEYEEILGFQATKNFLKYSGKQDAYYLCYYTGILELPDSYDGLEFKYGKKDGCDVDEQKYDVLFYATGTIAGGKTPITPSLLKSPVERFIMGVFHEDFHEQVGGGLPEGAMNESFTTFIGFATASKFAKDEFGAQSEIYAHLSGDIDAFLGAALVANRYHRELSDVFTSYRDGAITEQQALEEKDKIFWELQDECQKLPATITAWQCPGLNNAYLAFNVTYSKYYPLIYDLYMAQGQDVAATAQTIIELSHRDLSEKEAVDYLQNKIDHSPPP